VQAFVSYQMADARHTWEGECKPIRWQTCKQHDHVEMVVSCSDKTTGTFEQDGRLIASYLNNPGPLSCWVSENGNLKCENRPPAPVKVAQGS
jgi:hypothetical protein